MIQVKGITKYFLIRHNLLVRLRHSDHLVKAVDGVSFTIEDGEILGLIGESGCGKTTLAKVMLRLYEPTSGSVLFNGHDIMTMNKKELQSLRRKAQIIFQDSNSTLDPRMNVRHILEEPLLLTHIGTMRQRKERIEEMLQRVKLPLSLLSRYPSELSGGQRQRLAIARSLLLTPSFIIADEPLSGLDSLVSVQLLDLLLSLESELKLTLLFISHNLRTVIYASNRIMVMYRGKVVEIADADNFESEVRHPYTKFLLDEQAAPIKGETNIQMNVHAQHDDDGCVFRHKCPEALKVCAESHPPLQEISDGHHLACYRTAL